MRVQGVGRRRAIAVGLGVVLGVLVLPASAMAATASVSGSTFTFSAAAGEQNDLRVETDGGLFRVIDNTAPVTAGAGCIQRSTHRVNCPNAGVTLVEVLARDHDDLVETLIGTTDATLNGGSGTDELTSGEGNDVLSAGKGGSGFLGEGLSSGDGEDTLHGTTTSNRSTFMAAGPGDDELLGGPGQDTLFGDLGADVLQGGGGDFDGAFWGGAAAINVTIGSGANDGEPGEGDDVGGDVEQLSGTSFNDVLVGTVDSQSLFGSSGKDTLEGREGDDFLDGGDSADTLEGEEGEDQLQGGPRGDDFSGGPDADRVDYGDHVSAVNVTIDNVANDGTGGESDNVRTDVENLRGGNNDDTLIGSGQDNELVGDGGDDDVRGESGDDLVFGDFEFQGGTGDDEVSGGNGDDRLFGGGGGDNFQGGDDFDFVDYAQQAGSTDLTITIDNVANDGAAGEGDNVMDTVEGVEGANGNDTITGGAGPNTLFGGGGMDDLSGAGGKDLLDGETPGAFNTLAADVINGGAGEDTASYRSHQFTSVTVDIDGVADDGQGGGAEGDNVKTDVENLIGSDNSDSLTGDGDANTISGRNGSDILTGGAGGDSLAGGSGNDTHEGQGGKDEINSRDGFSDTDNCGSENDTAIIDGGGLDTTNNCETIIP
jgi:Ca2+-binding RTX toxin-like protein